MLNNEISTDKDRIFSFVELAGHFGLTEILVGFNEDGGMSSIHFLDDQDDADMVASFLDVHILTLDKERFIN